MTGLVVVSHSRALAEAAVELASEMVSGGGVRIEVAAGLDETTLGTDATAIMTAVEAADDGVGVVILMDLGSAVMSAELAVEMLDPELAARVVLSPAPLVEGLVVAAVAAAGGASPDRVAAEAAGALGAKRAHLGLPDESTPVSPTEAAGVGGPDTEAVTCELLVTNAQGLHARPAARLVAEVGRYDAEVTLRNLTTDSDPVPGDSMIWVATLGAARGHRVEVRATGSQAAEVLVALQGLAHSGFGDSPS